MPPLPAFSVKSMHRTKAHLALAFLLLSVGRPLFAADSPVRFNRQVRPLLSNKCYACHGPDASQRQTDLRLDDQAVAVAELESGVRAIVPGDPPRSELFVRVSSQDPDMVMPPPDSGKHLTRSEIQTLRRWIEQGAPWGLHWSFIPPTRPSLPDVKDTSWPRRGLDFFILAQLEQKGWRPSAPADKQTLIRRVTLALTGLPPTPLEVDTFLADDSPEAYEKLVDRLLQSPRYGEHMARYWLDVARYGDTHGLHLDNERSIWPYRDWVIDALNRNLPFDQFTIEQLAGDLLPDATLEQRIATGFHRCNVTTSEGGAISEEFLARYATERVETTSTVWLGLTAGCAACHDHKFDPISQIEFYQLYAYFYSLTEKAMDGNALLPPPSVKAPTHVQRLRHQRWQDQLAALTQRIQTHRTAAKARQPAWEPGFAAVLEPPSPTDHVLRCRLDGAEELATVVSGPRPAQPTVQGPVEWTVGRIDGAVSLGGDAYLDLGPIADFDYSDPFSLSAWVNISSHKQMAVLSKMVGGGNMRGYAFDLRRGRPGVDLVSRGQDNAVRVHTTLPLSKEKWHHVCATYDGSGEAAGVRLFVDGQLQDLEITQDQLNGSLRNDESLLLGRRDEGDAFSGLIDDVRIYDRTLEAEEVDRLATEHPLASILAIPRADRTERENTRLVDAYLREHVAEADRLFVQVEEVRQRIAHLENQFPGTLVMQQRDTPRDAHVLIRGQYDQKGEKVVPGVPAVLPPLSRTTGRPRLDLAHWLVSPANPLTARVTVNRIWQRHFGVGLVKSAEDFGSQGDWPSHPELLDYLATSLMESGWDIKALHRMIVTSATFQQSSRMSSETIDRDPENRYLSRGPRFRLDAEVIRDLALSVSGLLVGELGGASVKPYQPDGLWRVVAYPTSTTATFQRDQGSKLYRRSMYTFWKRTAPPPSMQVLDAPSREVCTVQRPRTNTPGAALMLMNDVQFLEAARKFAERIVTAGGKSTSARLEFAYRTALSRSPRAAEAAVLEQMLHDYQAVYQADPSLAAQLLRHGDARRNLAIDTSQLAAWTMLASTIMNLDEMISQH